MKTLKFHIHTNADADFCKQRQRLFVAAFHAVYVNMELSADPVFEKDICKQFNLGSFEYRSVVIAVKIRLEAAEEIDKNKTESIADVQIYLNKLKKDSEQREPDRKKRKNGIRNRIKSERRLHTLTSSLKNKPVFGGRFNLQQISRFSNRLARFPDSFKNQEELKAAEKTLQFHKDLYQKNRSYGTYAVGEANQYGNRYFDLKNISDGIIIFKPDSKHKIRLDFVISKNRQKELVRLQGRLKEKNIPVTVFFKNNQICLSYDEEILSGGHFDKKLFRMEKTKIVKQRLPKDTQEAATSLLWKSFRDEQKARKFADKNSNRFAAVDLNPQYVGFVIVEKQADGTFKHLVAESYDLSKLSAKLKVASNDPLQKKQRNKRVHEVHQLIKHLFNQCKHYKVAHFVVEKLNFKETFEHTAKEANRKTKNVWHRNLFETKIKSKCAEEGIILETINPAYSSFIGNVRHGYVDPANAAAELAERASKRKDGHSYMKVLDSDVHTVKGLLPADIAISIDGATWPSLYNSSRNIRWRKRYGDAVTKSRVGSILTYRSNIRKLSFKTKLYQKCI